MFSTILNVKSTIASIKCSFNLISECLVHQVVTFTAYYRLFYINGRIKWAIYVGIAVCLVVYTTLIFLVVFLTLQLQLYPNFVLAAVILISDFYILVLLIVAMSKLQICLRHGCRGLRIPNCFCQNSKPGRNSGHYSPSHCYTRIILDNLEKTVFHLI